jgi:hypothetical protein
MDFSDGFAIRDYSRASAAFVIALYLVIPAMTVSLGLWSRFTSLQRALIYVLIVMSSPLLFGMERGNLVILCMPLAALALMTDGWRRALAIALLINVKPYFAILLLAPLVAGTFAEFFLTGLMAGAIFLGTGLILDPNFMSFLGNILSFSGSDDVFSGREVLALPSSVGAFAYAAGVFYREGQNGGVLGVSLGDAAVLVQAVNALALLSALAALALAGRRLERPTILAVLMVLIANLGIWVGGYFFMIFPVLVPVLLKMRRGWLHAGLVVAILLPLDSIVLFSDLIPTQNIFLSGVRTQVEWQLGLGSILRPILDLALLASVTLDVVAELDMTRLRNYLTRRAISV